MIVLIAVVVILLTLVVGALLGVAVSRLDKAVVASTAGAQNQAKTYNPAVTMGHKIPVTGDYDAQMKEARQLAARQAATTPRGANMRIGNLRQEMGGKQPTAFDGLKEDPVTAVKIANVHGWDSVRTGMAAGAAAPAAAAPTAAAPAAVAGPVELVPGKDYPYIEITDSMSDEDKRKARIANSKAKSAATKAAKASGQTGTAAPVAADVAAPVAAKVAAPSAAAAAGIAEPVMIEITDSMSPDDVRKARIANSKAKAAYNKALKAAGVDVGAAAEVEPEAAPVVAAAAAPAPAALSGIPKPDLIEITEGMSPDDVRKARIANSKAMSAYNKALKAAGIDPSTVN
ncbi:MAG: hypothetical protein IPM39_02220 [Chloroflexi bacterium]|nr:hypothetical protein [Chloroflexota bacterium]